MAPPPSSNTRVVFAAYPTTLPVPGEHLVVEKVDFDIQNAQLDDNEFLLRNLVLSVDPYMRGRMRPSSTKSYVGGFPLGSVPVGHGVAEVIKSKNAKFAVGDIVYGMIGWEEYTKVAAPLAPYFSVRNQIRDSKVPISYYVGALGMPGMTAYIGLLKHGAPIKEGETLFVSAASGAVGQLVGQIGKRLGLHVVGSAGDDSKTKYLVEECGYDAAFNYKTSDMDQKLTELCPNGIDIYFENVGGKTLEHVLNHCNTFARIIVCGMISQYNLEKPEPIHNLMQLISKRIRMEGFIVSDSAEEWGPRFFKDMEENFREHGFIYREDIVEGVANAPEAFVGMLQGKNFGKQVIKIADL